MSDHEFEKKVQQKMDELRLRPSDAVWAEVENNLRREKRRRRTLIWLPILGVLLTAGGYFIFSGTGNPQEGSLVNNQATGKTVAPPAANAPVSASTPASSSSTEKNNEPSSQNSTQSNKEDKGATVAAQPNPSIDRPVGNNNVSGQTLTVARKKKKMSGEEDIQSKKVPNLKTPVQKTTNDSMKLQIDSNAIADNTLEAVNPLGIDRSAFVTNDIEAPAFKLAIESGPAAKKKYPVASKWQWGITANGGVANISEGSLFNLLKSVRVEDLTDAGPQYNGIPPAPAPEPSAIEPGALYSAGAFVQKGISKRISLSAGLQYSQWSVRTRVGRRENVARAVNYSNFDQQVVGYSYSSYAGLRDYTNRYHFVELPLTLSYRFNNNRRLPLVLDGGLSFSRLVYTNALHFDGISRVYYENDDFFRKLQVGVNAGVNVGIMQRWKTPIWIGPSLRYFTSGILKSELAPSGAQHLWSFGINAKMLLKK